MAEKEYIERGALRNELLKISICTDDIYGCGILEGLDRATRRVNNASAADVVEVVHASWDKDGRCTNCGGHAPYIPMSWAYHKSPYCFTCGAKMDGGKTE